MEPNSRKRLKNRKSGFFHFPVFRITCIIRNDDYQKKAAALLSFYRDSGGGSWCSGRIPASFCKTVRSYLYSRVDAVFFIKAPQRSETRFFFFEDAMFFIPAMAVCQSMHRPLHNRFAPPSGSLPHCQSVPHPLHWSQSTVRPERPGNPHLPAR